MMGMSTPFDTLDPICLARTSLALVKEMLK